MEIVANVNWSTHKLVRKVTFGTNEGIIPLCTAARLCVSAMV